MGISNYSVYTKFKAKDGVSPIFSAMTRKADKFDNKIQASMNHARKAMGNFSKVALKSSAAVLPPYN